MLTEVPLGQWAMFIGNMSEKVTFQVGTGSITIETGKMAKQADGAVTVQLGETIVLVAAVGAANAKPGRISSRSRSITVRKPPRRASSRAATSSAKGVPPKKKFSPAG